MPYQGSLGPRDATALGSGAPSSALPPPLTPQPQEGGAQINVQPPASQGVAGTGRAHTPAGSGQINTPPQEYSGIASALERLAPLLSDADTARNLHWQREVDGDKTKLGIWRLEATGATGLQFYAYMQPGEAFLVVGVVVDDDRGRRRRAGGRAVQRPRESHREPHARGCWLEDIPDLRRLLLEDGCEEDDVIDGPTSSTSAMRNYDLAYNLATYILVCRVSRPRSRVVDATNLLVRAEKWAKSIVVDENENENDENRRLLSERESNPIRANLAMARFLLGGRENETEAYRACLTLLWG